MILYVIYGFDLSIPFLLLGVPYCSHYTYIICDELQRLLEKQIPRTMSSCVLSVNYLWEIFSILFRLSTWVFDVTYYTTLIISQVMNSTDLIPSREYRFMVSVCQNYYPMIHICQFAFRCVFIILCYMTQPVCVCVPLSTHTILVMSTHS